MLGIPGAGKSMLAHRQPTVLPAMSLTEALKPTRLHRVAGVTGGHTAFVTPSFVPRITPSSPSA